MLCLVILTVRARLLQKIKWTVITYTKELHKKWCAPNIEMWFTMLLEGILSTWMLPNCCTIFVYNAGLTRTGVSVFTCWNWSWRLTLLQLVVLGGLTRIPWTPRPRWVFERCRCLSRYVSPIERTQEEELLSLNLERGKCKYTRLGLPSFIFYSASWLLCHTALVIMSPNMGSAMYDLPCFFLFYSCLDCSKDDNFFLGFLSWQEYTIW